MRVLLFFLWFIGFGIGLPALVLGFIKYRAQPAWLFDDAALKTDNGVFVDAKKLAGDETVVDPADVRAVFPDADAATMCIFRDVTRLIVIRCDNAQKLNGLVTYIYQQNAAEKPKSEENGSRFKTHTGEFARIRRNDPYLFAVFGPTQELTEQRFKSIGGAKPNPNRTLGNKIEAEYKLPAIGLILLWALFISAQFCRMASWAGTVLPEGNRRPADMTSVRKSLLAINDQPDVPFTVKPGDAPNELVIDWKYADAKWMDLMRAHGMKKAYRLVLRLDNDEKTVRAKEYETSLDWSAGGGPNVASLNWKSSTGINFFHYSHQRVFGLQMKGGKLTLDPSYSYTFNLNELKQPVIGAVTESGWQYRPVLTFVKWIGG